MQLSERIEAFVKLGDIISKENKALTDAVTKAQNLNPWFTSDNVWSSLLAIKDEFLVKHKIESWLSNYNMDTIVDQKSIGLIMAGNIPLVGFHDVLSILMTGHKVLIKYSEKDKVLIGYLLEELTQIEPRFTSLIEAQERLKSYDAVIATGSDNSAKIFETYFAHVPHVIRKNRNAVAVLYNDVNNNNLKNIGHDIFRYFGLGCRNVSKLYLEEGFNTDLFFEAIYDFGNVISHNKYKNNYDYTNALLLLNSEKFLTNNFLILRPHKSFSSRIASLNYESFNDENHLINVLNENIEKIQCIVSSKPIKGLKTFELGQAQTPGLEDYADGVDTIQFLMQL